MDVDLCVTWLGMHFVIKLIKVLDYMNFRLDTCLWSKSGHKKYRKKRFLENIICSTK